MRELPGEDGERWGASARQLYEARPRWELDDAGQAAVAAGRFYFLSADPDRAIAAFRASLKLDPAIESQYMLAGAYAGERDRRKLQDIL